MTDSSEIEIQRRYYAETANRYDSMHLDENDEHFFALSSMVGAIDYLGIQSILDIGSGTGRALQYVKKQRPSNSRRAIWPYKNSGLVNWPSQEEYCTNFHSSLRFLASSALQTPKKRRFRAVSCSSEHREAFAGNC